MVSATASSSVQSRARIDGPSCSSRSGLPHRRVGAGRTCFWSGSKKGGGGGGRVWAGRTREGGSMKGEQAGEKSEQG